MWLINGTGGGYLSLEQVISLLDLFAAAIKLHFVYFIIFDKLQNYTIKNMHKYHNSDRLFPHLILNLEYSYMEGFLLSDNNYIQNMFSLDSIMKDENDFNPLGNDFTPNADFPFLNQCLTNFYDQDSQEEALLPSRCSVQEVICYLQHALDICDTPLNDIMEMVTSNHTFRGLDLELVRCKVIKMKNKLKRQRAKNRKNFIREVRHQPVYIPLKDEADEEWRKKRNRLSAQISRDKNKTKTKTLEDLNKQLSEECRQHKEENQRLKRQVSENNANKGNAFKNPFTRMLIFLGIFFLFTVAREILDPSESSKAITQIQQNTANILAKDYPIQPFLDQKTALQHLQDTLIDSVDDVGMVERVKKGVREKLQGWWTHLQFMQVARQQTALFSPPKAIN